MLKKMGACTDRVAPQIRRSRAIVDAVYKDFGWQPVLNSGRDGQHMTSSLHYFGLAEDYAPATGWDKHNGCPMRLPRETLDAMAEKMKEQLKQVSPHYQVLTYEWGHHIEYDEG